MYITREKMAKLDKRAVEDFGIDSILLMENAAFAVFQHVKRYNSYTVVCGSGNNGGDGLALARHLIINNKEVDVFIIQDAKTPDAKKNLDILKRMTRNIYFINEVEDLEILKNSLVENEVVIDAIFGIGLDRDVVGICKHTIDCINEFGHLIISIDVPSGMDANTGKIQGSAIVAHETIAIHDEKMCSRNRKICGKISTVYIGIPGENMELIQKI